MIKRLILMAFVLVPGLSLAQSMNDCSSLPTNQQKTCQQTANDFQQVLTTQQQAYQQDFAPVIAEGQLLIQELGQMSVSKTSPTTTAPTPTRPQLTPEVITPQPASQSTDELKRPSTLPSYY